MKFAIMMILAASTLVLLSIAGLQLFRIVVVTISDLIVEAWKTPEIQS